MNVTEFTIHSVAAGEIQQLLAPGSQPVFWLLCSSEQGGISGSIPVLIPGLPAVADGAGATPALFPWIPATAADSSGAAASLSHPAATDHTVSQERILADYLHRLGIPPHIRGYEYLKKAVEFAAENPSLLCAITKELYPNIARCCGTNAANVERAIRHAIETAWNRGSLQLQEELFGNTVGSVRSRPTNSEFIAAVAERLRLGAVS